MSQAAVERTLGKLVTDETFRVRFFRDPAGASFSAGLELSRAELEALSRLPIEAITQFSAVLDVRICRLPLDEEGEPILPEARPVRRRRTDYGTEPACDPAQSTKEIHQ